MAKKKAEGYLSVKESRRISKENRRITKEFEKKRKRKNVPESEYLTTMHDPNNSVEFDNLHTHFYTDAGVVKAVDGVSFEVDGFHFPFNHINTVHPFCMCFRLFKHMNLFPIAITEIKL